MENNKLRQRFVKDYDLPINIFEESMFRYYAELYDFFPKETWENVKKMIDEKFDGNVERWLDYCAEVRDNAINSVIESDVYKEFNSKKMDEYKLTVNVGEHSCYNQETDGCRFISIDLKKANFQALKYVGVLNDESYNSFMDKFGADEYIKGSKYLRQVIFGKMNPGRTTTVEKYIMEKIMSIANEVLPMEFKLYSQNSDELVYKQTGTSFYGDIKIICGVIESVVKQKFGIDVRAEYIEVKKLPIVNCNDSNVDAFVRTNLITGESVLKKTSTLFYPQVYKIWKGLEIESRDLMFYAENQTAHFDKPLKVLR